MCLGALLACDSVRLCVRAFPQPFTGRFLLYLPTYGVKLITSKLDLKAISCTTTASEQRAANRISHAIQLAGLQFLCPDYGVQSI